MPFIPNLRKLFFVLLFVLMVLLFMLLGPGSPYRLEAADPPPDNREIEIQFPDWVTIAFADCSEGCYRIIYGDYQPDTESGGNILIMAQVDADGDGIYDEGARWTVGYPGTEVPLTTKRPPEWGDFPMYGGCFFPDQGESGPFYAYAGDDPARSDVVMGMGLPYCHHVNYLIRWYWEPGGPPPPPLPYQVYAPIIGVMAQ